MPSAGGQPAEGAGIRLRSGGCAVTSAEKIGYFEINPKSEARNSKQIQNSNDTMTQTKQTRPTMHGHQFNKYHPEVPLFSDFEFCSFEFVSDFDIRISCFSCP
jgi:hypothetical protein